MLAYSVSFQLNNCPEPQTAGLQALHPKQNSTRSRRADVQHLAGRARKLALSCRHSSLAAGTAHSQQALEFTAATGQGAPGLISLALPLQSPHLCAGACYGQSPCSALDPSTQCCPVGRHTESLCTRCVVPHAAASLSLVCLLLEQPHLQTGQSWGTWGSCPSSASLAMLSYPPLLR